MAKPTYFTCTLGQAFSLGLTDPTFKNINTFIDSKATSHPSLPAAGFAVPSAKDSGETWGHRIFTFTDVRKGSVATAAHIRALHDQALKKSKTVALICPSTPQFLFTWLALMRLGHAVLLIAPQCQPAAVAHLCKACDVSLLFHDEIYQDLAMGAAREASAETELNAVPIFSDISALGNMTNGLTEGIPLLSPDVGPSDVAYLHHTSGTSSGVPKPIAQTHRAGAGVLPCLPDGHKNATFTTTPLYHGGIADLFRAWASNAMIWLFPGKGIPITATNIVKCLDVAAECSTQEGLPPVRYFSSVPYVLQSMEADERGLQYLQSMDIVGVGGAALPAEVGNRLVEQGVNLISRFGSAECGFIMSSHREYESDKEWQYLRSDQRAKCLEFEEQPDGLSELVILDGWPHMAKRNRDNQSFATADLFARHAKIQNAWRYHSRADSQLTLVTGKKFDPAPLEGAISASDLLSDVLIFGNGQPFPGALLFRSPSSRDMSNHEIKDKLWPVIEKLNSESADHARIPQSMLIPMPVLEQPLEKSSKGTVIRGAAESRFRQEMDDAYVNMTGPSSGGDIPDEAVLSALFDIIQSIMPNKGKLAADTDLYQYGVDSVAGMQLRYGLRALLPQSTRQQLPLNIVEDCGTMGRLADYVIRVRHGGNGAVDDDDEDEMQLMHQLVDKYSKFDVPSRDAQGQLTNGRVNHLKRKRHPDELADRVGETKKDVVLLTGSTGALGAHVLDQYTKDATVSKVYCLVRGANPRASLERVRKALDQRGLDSLDSRKVAVLAAQIGEPLLGLTEDEYQSLADEVSIIMHVAWAVNFRMRLRSFEKENIASLTNLLNLALRSTCPQLPRFGYCSSVASVMSCRTDPIPESVLEDASAATTLGYSRSKVVIFRVGQLSGDSLRGVWNTKEAWPMMLSTVKLTKTLPNLEKESLDWLPVDIAARALVEGMTSVADSGVTTDVLHILNDTTEYEWRHLLGWMQKRESFRIVSPSQWVKLLEKAAEEANAEHPAFKLLGLWREAYLGQDHGKDRIQKEGSSDKKPSRFDMVKTKRAIPALRAVGSIDEEYFSKIWTWIDCNM